MSQIGFPYTSKSAKHHSRSISTPHHNNIAPKDSHSNESNHLSRLGLRHERSCHSMGSLLLPPKRIRHRDRNFGQLDDGQNRINGPLSSAQFCIADGAIADAHGRGCIITRMFTLKQHYYLLMSPSPSYPISMWQWSITRIGLQRWK